MQPNGLTTGEHRHALHRLPQERRSRGAPKQSPEPEYPIHRPATEANLPNGRRNNRSKRQKSATDVPSSSNGGRTHKTGTLLFLLPIHCKSSEACGIYGQMKIQKTVSPPHLSLRPTRVTHRQTSVWHPTLPPRTEP